MTILERSIGDVTILDIDGRITVQEGADVFREAVQRLVNQGRVKLVVNLRLVPYIDSTALGDLVWAFTTAVRRGGPGLMWQRIRALNYYAPRCRNTSATAPLRFDRQYRFAQAPKAGS